MAAGFGNPAGAVLGLGAVGKGEDGKLCWMPLPENCRGKGICYRARYSLA